LSNNFLQEIPTGLPLVAVVAGQTEPKLPYGENEKWIRKFSLQRVTLECWTNHLQQQGIQLPNEKLRPLYEKAEGVPHYLRLVSYSFQMGS